MSRRGVNTLFWGGLAVLVLLVALLLTGGTNNQSLDPRSVSDDGAKALVDLVTSFGAEVELGTGVPGSQHEAAVLLSDTYGIEERQALEDWVRSGGRLLVADATSPLTPPTIGLSEVSRQPCPVPALSGVSTVDGASARYGPPSGGASCFEGAVSVDPVGEGTVVSVGGPEPLLNGHLDQADNAVMAVAVLAPEPGTAVAFLEPRVAGSDAGESLTDLIPDPVWVLLIQLGVAFGLVAWWQARRLGAPVSEPSAVVIEGSELAAARGRLLESIGRPEAAAADLRASTRRHLRRRLGLPPDASTAVIASRAAPLASRVGHTFTESDVVSLLDTRPVASDADLFTLAGGLADLRNAVSADLRPAGTAASTPTLEGEAT